MKHKTVGIIQCEIYLKADRNVCAYLKMYFENVRNSMYLSILHFFVFTENILQPH